MRAPIPVSADWNSGSHEMNHLLPHWKYFRNDRSHEFSDLNLCCSSRLTNSTCLSQNMYHPSLQHGIIFSKWVFLLLVEETSSRWRKYEWMRIAWHWIQLCFKHREESKQVQTYVVTLVVLVKCLSYLINWNWKGLEEATMEDVDILAGRKEKYEAFPSCQKKTGFDLDTAPD